MHSLYRLGCHGTSNVDFLVGILHLKRKSTNHSSHRTTQLCPSKVFADTGPLTMQESNLGKVGRGAAVVIGNSVTVLVGVDPALRDKLFSIITPEDRGSVDGIWAQDQAGSFRNGFPGDDGVTNGLAEGNRHSRV